MVSFYDSFMHPLERRGINHARKEIIPLAKKNVLEIGSGTGANLEFYNINEIDKLVLSDYKISKKLVDNIDSVGYKDKIELVELDVLDLPYEDNSFDYVVHSLVFCTVKDVDKGLTEIKRVLKDDGKLLFIEHIIPDKNPLKSLFKILTPAWKLIGSGCHLNKDYISSLKRNDFDILFHKKFMKTAFIYGVAFSKALS